MDRSNPPHRMRTGKTFVLTVVFPLFVYLRSKPPRQSFLVLVKLNGLTYLPGESANSVIFSKYYLLADIISYTVASRWDTGYSRYLCILKKITETANCVKE